MRIIVEIIGTYHFGNQTSFPVNIDITRINLFLYWIGEDESNEFTIRSH